MQIVTAVALALGAMDSAQFATRNPKRARQSLSVAVVWAIGFVLSLFSANGFKVAAAVVAALLTLGGIALLIIHLRHGIANARVWLAPALALVALIAAVVTL